MTRNSFFYLFHRMLEINLKFQIKWFQYCKKLVHHGKILTKKMDKRPKYQFVKQNALHAKKQEVDDDFGALVLSLQVVYEKSK